MIVPVCKLNAKCIHCQENNEIQFEIIYNTIMSKLLYVTYEWNFTKTCSSVFFPELLKKYFDVELCMIKDDSDLDADKINSSDYDSVIFFQC